jgi:hypothetical protein
MRPQLIEPMQAQVIGAALHVGGAEVDPQRFAQRGNVLEVDLFLKVLRPRRDQHPLAAQDRRDQIRERLARAGPGFGEQRAAAFEDIGDRRGHDALAVTRLELLDVPRQRAFVTEGVIDRGP